MPVKGMWLPWRREETVSSTFPPACSLKTDTHVRAVLSPPCIARSANCCRREPLTLQSPLASFVCWLTNTVYREVIGETNFQSVKASQTQTSMQAQSARRLPFSKRNHFSREGNLWRAIHLLNESHLISSASQLFTPFR